MSVKVALKVAIDFTAIAGGVRGYAVLECRSTSDGVKSTARAKAKGPEDSRSILESSTRRVRIGTVLEGENSWRISEYVGRGTLEYQTIRHGRERG